MPFEFRSMREGRLSRRSQQASSCVPKGRGLRETVRNPGGGRGGGSEEKHALSFGQYWKKK